MSESVNIKHFVGFNFYREIKLYDRYNGISLKRTPLVQKKTICIIEMSSIFSEKIFSWLHKQLRLRCPVSHNIRFMKESTVQS